MIMAQHPTQQRAPSRRAVGNADAGAAAVTNQHDPPITQSNHKQIREKANHFVPKISTVPQFLNPRTGDALRQPPKQKAITNENAPEHLSNSDNREQSNQAQDSKRTLIKNQLYLIEHLQLENANLRNERDQLQLENEELKFQLQMISSSNFLGQPGSGAFNSRRLEKLVETDGDIKAATTLGDIRPTMVADDEAVSCMRDGSKATNSTLLFDLYHANSKQYSRYNGQEHCANSLSLTSIAATPIRQPMKVIDIDHSTDGKEKPTPTNINTSCTRILSASNHDLRLPLVARHTDDNLAKTTTVKSLTTTPTVNKKLLNAKSISLSAFNIGSIHLPSSSAQKTDDELRLVRGAESADPMHSKLYVQIYGNSERVQTAAIIIQRAFREYRICKRFRTITEQLRHSCQPSYMKHDQKGSSRDGDSDQLSNSYSSSDKNSSTDSVLFASGATRAATCESLSQAVIHLAASAAATIKKQTATNGATKVAYCQQVAHFTSRQKQDPTETMPEACERSQVSLQSSSVVAAAINFQQLESIRKRQYRVGLNIFNKNPEKGVSFLIAHSFIDCSMPYMKPSTSYYLSNQLHFMDKQKLSSQQSIRNSEPVETTSHPPIYDDVTSAKSDLRQICRFCQEEENLKKNIAHFLLHRKGLAKEKIGEYLGNLQSKFIQDILVYYLKELDFNGLQIDVALRKFSSTLRMPGEAQKIERFVDRFACRYVECQRTQMMNDTHDYISSINDPAMGASDNESKLYSNKEQTLCNTARKNNLTMLSRDEIFILTFAIIMLNTDLHSPSLKSTTRMSANQFVNNLRGVFKSHTINEDDLVEIYERVKANQITTSPDHVTHVMKVQQGLVTNNFQKKDIPNLCEPHRRLVCFCRLFEVYDETKKERLGQHQREIFLFNDTLLVTKLAKRARANAPQQYTYRQSIPLQGLYVQLSQSAHYSFGIKLCRRSNNETVIMFNARNELDQGRFVDDLNESIAEMDEMEHIKSHKIVDSTHLKQIDRLRRHEMLHETNFPAKLNKITLTADEKTIIMEDTEHDANNTSSSNYSSFNSSSAAGSLMALCTKPAKMRCTVTMAAPAPMVVEPLDK